MKAKMIGNGLETGVYLCQICQIKFKYNGGKLICPKCLTADRDNLIMIYVEDDPEQEQLYNSVDWHGAD